MADQFSAFWNQSYSRQENNIFYPKEEIVKFLNHFVKRKIQTDSLLDVLKTPGSMKGLDLGCGIGRQTILFEEFNISGYGIDISEVALEKAHALAISLGFDMEDRFFLVKEAILPFENDFFDIAIVDSALDSMAFNQAVQYMQELNRTVKHLVYLNFISSECNQNRTAEDIVVETDFEQGTVQSYYDLDRINELISYSSFQIKQIYKILRLDSDNNSLASRYHVILERGK